MTGSVGDFEQKENSHSLFEIQSKVRLRWSSFFLLAGPSWAAATQFPPPRPFRTLEISNGMEKWNREGLA